MFSKTKHLYSRTYYSIYKEVKYNNQVIKISYTIEIDGDLLKKQNSTTQLTIAINPKVTYTEYVENEVIVSAGGSASISMGGIANPKFVYAETDTGVTYKCYRGASVIASAMPIESSMLLTPNAGGRFGTVTISNAGGSDANVKFYVAE